MPLSGDEAYRLSLRSQEMLTRHTLGELRREETRLEMAWRYHVTYGAWPACLGVTGRPSAVAARLIKVSGHIRQREEWLRWLRGQREQLFPGDKLYTPGD